MKMDNLLQLTESLDSKFDSVKWGTFYGAIAGTGELDGNEYKILIQPFNFDGEQDPFSWLNIAFIRMVDGKPEQDLIGDKPKSAMKIFGAIANELKDKIPKLNTEYDIKALIFVAITTEHKRFLTYKKIISSSLLAPWKFDSDITTKHGSAVIASKKKLSKEDLDGIKGNLEMAFMMNGMD